MTYKNRDIYSGNWANGQKDGKGTYVFAETGQKFVGQFLKGQMITGQWQYSNGSYFKGNFDNNKPKGNGDWVFKNGNKVSGFYSQTRRAETQKGEDDIKLNWQTAM